MEWYFSWWEFVWRANKKKKQDTGLNKNDKRTIIEQQKELRHKPCNFRNTEGELRARQQKYLKWKHLDNPQNCKKSKPRLER